MTTYPKHWLDIILWPMIRLFWEPFSRKNAHWWHWKEFYSATPYPTKPFSDASAKDRVGFIKNLLQTNFGWKKAVVLSPENGIRYRRGFISCENGIYKKEICSVVIEGPSAGLIGPSPVQFFAVSYPEGNPIELQFLYQIKKSDLKKSIFLT